MTSAPADLIGVQRDVHAIVRIAWDELGITGDAEHADGGDSYHLGRDQLRADASYSVHGSPRNKHPTDAASAFDLGDGWELGLGSGPETDKAAKETFLRFNKLYVAALKNGVPGTEDIREIIYTSDGTTIKRLDVLGERTGGSDKHRHHTAAPAARPAVAAARIVWMSPPAR